VLDESILVLSIVVLSGGKSVLRIFIAATVFYLVPELLRGFKEYRLLVFGAFLVLFPVYENRFREIAITLRGYVARLLPKHLLESKKDSYDNFKPDYSPILIRKENVSLKLCGVTKNFAGLRALDNISFERHLSKTITALIGPNGAGKTTLFNCLSGIERTTEGTISFGTINDINYVPAYELAVSGIGRTFQNVRLFKTMSVYQNVMVGCFCGKTIPFWQSLIGTKKYKDFMTACSSKADYYIELLGLVPLRHANVCGLPFGLQRKVEIARALAVEPSFLLLDEVASGLNDGEKKELANTLRNLTQTLGISIFLVEHDMPFVMDLAEHIIVLDSGKIIAEGTPHLISKDQQVIEAYLGNPYAVG
jgi:ABC-type branched-subunit amino acid transport system ATPase component